MTRVFLAGASLCLLMAIGCAKTGSTSTERTKNGSEAATTAQGTESTTTPAPPPADPLAPIPDFPDPAPTGWREFDAYFEQLIRVHHEAIDKGAVEQSDVAKLEERDKALTGDASQQYQPSMPMRKTLATQITEFRQLPKQLPPLEMLERLRGILQSTRDIIQTVPTPGPGHQEKLDNMMNQLENSVVRERMKGK
jgi:hypothetical protein